MKYEGLNVATVSVNKNNDITVHKKTKTSFRLLKIMFVQCIAATLLFGLLFSAKSYFPEAKIVVDGAKSAILYNIEALGTDSGDIGKLMISDKVKAVFEIEPKDDTPVVLHKPLQTELIDNLGGYLAMESSGSTVVFAAEKGKIDKVYTSAGERVIEIKHRQGFTTRYTGVAVTGVKTGQTIDAGMTIGTLNSTGVLKFCLLFEDNVVSNIDEYSDWLV